jgi:hypothetical protein
MASLAKDRKYLHSISCRNVATGRLRIEKSYFKDHIEVMISFSHLRRFLLFAGSLLNRS